MQAPENESAHLKNILFGQFDFWKVSKSLFEWFLSFAAIEMKSWPNPFRFSIWPIWYIAIDSKEKKNWDEVNTSIGRKSLEAMEILWNAYLEGQKNYYEHGSNSSARKSPEGTSNNILNVIGMLDQPSFGINQKIQNNVKKYSIWVNGNICGVIVSSK